MLPQPLPFLTLNSCNGGNFTRQIPHHQARDPAHRVSLVGFALHPPPPPIHFGPVTLFVFGSVIGMDGVDHVNTEEEVPSYG